MTNAQSILITDARLVNEGAVVVTRPQTGEVLALVGDRREGYAGFNRALAARRPVGSLLKPAVYLAATQPVDLTRELLPGP